MKFTLIFIFSLSNAIWKKCSKPCNGGVETNDESTKRACNYERCEIYTDQLLSDGFMETEPGEFWVVNGENLGVTLEADPNSWV